MSQVIKLILVEQLMFKGCHAFNFKEYQMLVKDSKSNAEAINSEEEMGNSPALLEKEEEEREVKYLSCMSRIRSVVEKLPTANRHTLQYIIAHLSR